MMSNKHVVIAMRMHPAPLKIEGPLGKQDVDLIPGTIGVLFVFESKKAAIEAGYKEQELIRVWRAS